MSAANEESFQSPPPPPMPQSTPRGPRPSKLLFVAIGFFIIGAVIAAGGVAKFFPGGLFTGAILALCSVVLAGLSFVPLPLVPEPEEPLPLLTKALGIFYEPSRVFRNLRSHPHWIGAFVIVGVLTAIYSFAFTHRITPERIVDHTMEKVAEMGPPFAQPPDRMEAMRAEQLSALKNPIEQVGNVIKSFSGLFVLGAFVAALSMLGVLAFGGKINFWQAMAVTFYASLPIVVIQKLLGLVVLYLKAPEDLHPILNAQTTVQDNLGVLMSPAAHPVLFVLLSFVGITTLYSVWLKAKGLHLGATKANSGTGWGVSITLMILLMIFVTIWTALFPQFIS